jgi:putative heme-binding domain-containing protein
VKTVIDKADVGTSQQLLAALAAKVQNGELQGAKLTAFKTAVQPVIRQHLQGKADAPLFLDVALLAATLKDPAGYGPVRQLFLTKSAPEAKRVQALEALIAGQDDAVKQLVGGVLGEPKAHSAALRGQVVTTLGRADGPWVATLLLERYADFEPDVQARAVEVLTQRPAWSKALLLQIGDKKLPPTVLNLTQARKLLVSKDKELADLVKKHWGVIRDERNPEREKIVTEMKKLLAEKRGDAAVGKLVFSKHCGVCHKMHGEGQEVGPDITVNGRGDFDQLVSNVFDPNLVIGSGYQATTVTTGKGQVLSGLLVEDNKQRVVLKVQGGEVKTIGRDDVDTVKLTPLSLMPEQMEKQMSTQEIRDLFAYLTLDRPPGDPKAKLIPGTPR